MGSVRRASYKTLRWAAWRACREDQLLALVLLLEALDAAGGVEQLLLAGVEGVAARADVHRERAAGRGHRVTGTTGARHRGGAVARVDRGLRHDDILQGRDFFSPWGAPSQAVGGEDQTCLTPV